MTNTVGISGNFSLENHGLRNLNTIYWTLPTPALVERAVARREGLIGHEGALIVRTGHHTGRSANDKFIVKRDGESGDKIWWGKINRPMTPEHFERLCLQVTSYLQGLDVFVQDAYAGAHPDYRIPIRVITEHAWHSLFARNLFLRTNLKDLPSHIPEYTILHAPHCHANPKTDGTNSETFIALDLEQRLILIGGTSYAGEIKKSIFTIMNYLLPLQGVLSMHCSANVGRDGQVALFFGLSGTGKTTLSSDTDRPLIGDDEHGWGDDGVFNFEGGCYAKTIRLDPELEPLIWGATRRFGTILENVALNMNTRKVDFDNDSFTENTRAAYPIGFLANSLPEGQGDHPTNVFFLTADAFGVLPPISRLTPEQAMYYFISGYTSKLGGTEKGLGKEPQPNFSACFGAPFLPLHPQTYAKLLGEKIERHHTKVWLVNTGWTGGPYGTGKRMPLPYTRAMVTAALNGNLDDVPYKKDPFFALSIPQQAPNVPSEVLNPRQTWEHKDDYNEQAKNLVRRFKENFEEYSLEVSPEIRNAGPS